MIDLPERGGTRPADLAKLRVPPQSTEAEQSVLGGLLLDNTAWDRAADLLRGEDFYRHEHRIIHAAMAALMQAGKPVDVVTVFERLQAQHHADEAGGLAYLNALAQSVPSAANVRTYAQIVRERAVLRRLIAAGDQIATRAFEGEGQPIATILDAAEGLILAIGDAGIRAGHEVQAVAGLIVPMLGRVEDLQAHGGDDVTGVRMGLRDLDRITAGLQPGDLVVLAARPSMGKTGLALNIAEQVAIRDGLPVAVFSMEMGAAQLALRFIGSLGAIDQSHLRTGRLLDAEWQRLGPALELLANAPLYVDESPALTPGELRAKARRVARQCGRLGLVVVDYLQLMSGSGSGENRATEVGEISRGMKGLAKELQCPVMALSQLNRSVESRADKRPIMSDLRESGAIEQDADVIMFIYRDDYYNAENCEEPGVAEINIAKQRNGPTGTVKLSFIKPLTKFTDLNTGGSA